MKLPTFSRMALARLRADKRGYRSLLAGIFLSVFFISTLVLGLYGMYFARLQRRQTQTGKLDMAIVDSRDFGDRELAALSDFDEIGHAYLSATVESYPLALGYYDETALALLELAPLEGRLPQAAGEIALEASALDVLDTTCALGDTLTLSLHPYGGSEEVRSFTVVGFLPERSVFLAYSDSDTGLFPALLTSPQEAPFTPGRVETQYLLHLAPGVTVNDGLDTLLAAWENHGFQFYGLNVLGEQLQFSSRLDVFSLGSELVTLFLLLGFLGFSLLLCCGVGISCAMEGLLMKRREEIGILRAVGATRRQIRRLYGRENWMLALTAAPLALGVSTLCVFLLSRLFPGELVLSLSPALLVPILLFSAVMVLLSGYLPLLRASRQMPMQVLRDTAMLRRAKGLRYKVRFSVPRLIAARQLRFHPTRQLGASLLVGLALLSSGLLYFVSGRYLHYTQSESAAFVLQNFAGYSYEGLISVYSSHQSITDSGLSRLRRLPHVSSVRVERQLPVIGVFPQVPEYAMLSWRQNQLGCLTQDMLQTACEYSDLGEYFLSIYPQERQRYLDFCKTYRISGEAYGIPIITVDLDEQTLSRLRRNLSQGEVDADALQAGTGVLVYAPELWVKKQDKGVYSLFTSQPAGNTDYRCLARNTVAQAGQSLSLLQLYRYLDSEEIHRRDATVTIDGVLSGTLSLTNSPPDFCILTTEEGLRSMGLYREGVWKISLYTEDALTPEEERQLTGRIDAIARRYAGVSVENRLEAARSARQERRSQTLLIFSVTLLFFASAVGIIVSSATRHLQGEVRTIGMLRAVGADERTIVRAYSGQIGLSVLGGLVLCALLGVVYAAAYIASMHGLHLSPSDFADWGAVCLTVAAMAGLCALLCQLLLRLRIRQLMRKSISQTIQEL